MRTRRALPQVPTFAGGLIATSPSAEDAAAPPKQIRSDRTDVTVAECDVVVRVPDRIARRWRAGVLSSDLEPGDLIAMLLRRHRAARAGLAAPAQAEPNVTMTVRLPNATLTSLDGLCDTPGAHDRSSVCAALIAGYLDD